MRLMALFTILLLSACGPKVLEPKVVTSTKIIYPAVPNFVKPPATKLEPVKFDWPRDTSKLTVRNTRSCLSKFKQLYPLEDALNYALIVEDQATAVELEKNSSFWRSCGVNPVDGSSNLYIGMGEMQYKNLVSNFKLLMAREKQWDAILGSVNKLLESWRNHSEQVQADPKQAIK